MQSRLSAVRLGISASPSGSQDELLQAADREASIASAELAMLEAAVARFVGDSEEIDLQELFGRLPGVAVTTRIELDRTVVTLAPLESLSDSRGVLELLAASLGGSATYDEGSVTLELPAA